MLTYLERKTVVTHVERKVKPYKTWAMFTSQGNRSLQRKAEMLCEKIEQAHIEDRTEKKVRAFKNFFKGWRRMGSSRTMGEASDTAVREMVWCFACEVAKAIDFSEFRLDEIWEECS